MKYQLGVVIPVYNSTRSVVELLDAVGDALADIRYHVYLVDDSGNAEHSAWMAANCRGEVVTLIILAENSGQQNALLCGLRAASEQCNAVATMDDDLQHPPELLPRLYRRLAEGYDVVYAVSVGGNRPLHRRIGSFGRDLLFRLLLRIPRGIQVSSLRIMKGAVARRAAVHDYKFYYLTASALQERCRIANLRYPAAGRPYGRSGYRWSALLRMYIGILRTYTGAGRALTHPERGMGYTVARIYEGEESN